MTDDFTKLTLDSIALYVIALAGVYYTIRS